MTITNEMLTEIASALGGGVSSNYTTTSAVHDIFEGYVFSIVVAAAVRQGAIVDYVNVHGAPATALTFRTSPGNIYSTLHPYTHARIGFPNCPQLEAHIGIYVAGHSGVLHECDIAVVERLEGDVCRSQFVHPRCAKVPIAIECKFHAATLQLNHARSFLGLTRELKSDGRFLVTNTTSQTAKKLVNHHKLDWEFQLDPTVPEFPNAFRARIERAFRDWKVANGP